MTVSHLRAYDRTRLTGRLAQFSSWRCFDGAAASSFEQAQDEAKVMRSGSRPGLGPHGISHIPHDRHGVIRLRDQDLEHHIGPVHGSPHPPPPDSIPRHGRTARPTAPGSRSRLAANFFRQATERVMVVQAQHLHVGHRQPGALGRREDFRQRGHIGAGEDVFADEGPGGARAARTGRCSGSSPSLSGASKSRTLAKYSSKCPMPTCSIIPTETMRSNWPVRLR